jgi:hypothetical protein
VQTAVAKKGRGWGVIERADCVTIQASVTGCALAESSRIIGCTQSSRSLVWSGRVERAGDGRTTLERSACQSTSDSFVPLHTHAPVWPRPVRYELTAARPPLPLLPLPLQLQLQGDDQTHSFLLLIDRTLLSRARSPSTALRTRACACYRVPIKTDQPRPTVRLRHSRNTDRLHFAARRTDETARCWRVRYHCRTLNDLAACGPSIRPLTSLIQGTPRSFSRHCQRMNRTPSSMIPTCSDGPSARLP